MTAFADFTTLCVELVRTASRLGKRRLVAEFLRTLPADEVTSAVAFMTGRPFPVSDSRVLNVRGLPAPARDPGSATGPPLTIADVEAAFVGVAEAGGAGARRLKDQRLTALAARASEAEREVIGRIIGGEMRTGVSDGLVLEAIAEAAGADQARTRRAALFLGDLATVAALALTGGPDALAAVTPRLFVPMLLMLGEITSDFGEVFAAQGGVTALEFKYDGARVQVHSDGQRVGIWSRRLSDVTASLPDVVEIVRRDLRGAPFILDGEVVALDAAGRPLPFQELMRRFRRVHDVEALLGQVPLALHFFDCLVAEAQSLIDEPSERRWEALRRVTSGRYLAERSVVTTVAEADAFLARALAAGHEGVMAKDLRAAYEPGGRGKRWFKLKAAETVDCVIIAADRGSGRRVGWLSNYHLAVRDSDGWADVGKTFKGLTDQEFTAMTERLKSLAVSDDGYTVRVTPEIVVEVEYNEIQKSPTYPSGLALRFARIARIRDDKAPGQTTTLAQLRDLYEAQFRTKGRAG